MTDHFMVMADRELLAGPARRIALSMVVVAAAFAEHHPVFVRKVRALLAHCADVISFEVRDPGPKILNGRRALVGRSTICFERTAVFGPTLPCK